jgi:hypothetical protein
MLVITKITNKQEKYTAVNAFSSFELASEFMQKWLDSLSNDEVKHYDFSSEVTDLDKPDYPFLNKVY